MPIGDLSRHKYFWYALKCWCALRVPHQQLAASRHSKSTSSFICFESLSISSFNSQKIDVYTFFWKNLIFDIISSDTALVVSKTKHWPLSILAEALHRWYTLNFHCACASKNAALTVTNSFPRILSPIHSQRSLGSPTNTPSMRLLQCFKKHRIVYILYIAIAVLPQYRNHFTGFNI